MAPKKPPMWHRDYSYDNTQRERERREPAPIQRDRERERDPVDDLQQRLPQKKQAERPFDQKEIEGQAKKDAPQNLLTVFAFLVCGLSAIYLFLVAPFVGGGPVAFLTVVFSGIVGFCSLGWKWLTKKSAIAKKVQELATIEEKKRKEGMKAKLAQRASDLRGEFGQIDFADGLKELRELTAKYLDLEAYLGRRPESKFISNGQVVEGMNETYQQGISLLWSAFEIMRAAQVTDIKSLEYDIKTIEGELALEKIAEIAEIKRETLESHKKRIEKVREQIVYVTKLLAQSDKCEAVLHQTMLDLNMLDIEGSDEKVKEVVDRIHGAIETAIAVQEALKEKGLNV